VVNVGAGTGAYEPADLDVTAVEPSEVMIAQRPEGAAPVVRAFAEELPFEDGSFDAAMVVLSDHHSGDHERGLAELRRVARRVVLFTWEPASARETWVVRDYFPCFEQLIRTATGSR
jgi:ubiquinone/menaquinone biosynthesis C-methylase UbiE